MERSFSNKPIGGFKDWEEKIESYIAIISGPAMIKYDKTPYTFRIVEENSDSIFKFRDTLSSRAELGELNVSFKDEHVAIIGLGGTGAYVLDFLCRTPVKEIRGFDQKSFNIHNSFRSPGKLDKSELGKSKAEVYQKRYENFRYNLNIQSKYIYSDSFDELEGITFAFVCVDKGSSRSDIFQLLMKMKIPFIDVGMGLDRDLNLISGTIRTTYFSNENGNNLLDKRLVPLTDLPNLEYENNIQISELNAMNAALAVIKYKQLRTFYFDDNKFEHMLFDINAYNSVAE